MRLKAKAFIAQQAAQKQQQEKKAAPIDTNNFTCKFCNGSIETASNKFVHEKFCLVANPNQKTLPETK